ncbi:MAG: transketolase C-terminal domain-containing protein, partial [Pirellulales bacterium]
RPTARRWAKTRSKGPRPSVLTRQNLPTLDRSRYAAAAGLARGAYVLADAPSGRPDVLLLASGSEVSLCVAAHELLAKEGIQARVVSMPSWELFEAQDEPYRRAVLPAEVEARVAVEAGVIQGWHKYLGPRGRFVGMTRFGASAPGAELMRYLGFTPQNVVAEAKKAMADGS